MAFFDNLFQGLGVGGANVLSAGINLLGNVIGGNKAVNAAKEAAQINANAAARQEALLREAKNAATGYIDQGAKDYATTIEPLLAERPVLMPTFRGLTDQQQLGRQDLLRTGGAQLAASGLRGAGRAGLGVVMDQLRRYDAAARASNDAAALAAKQAARSSADNARAGLASVRANTGTAKGNAELGVGSALSGVVGNAGNVQAKMAADQGQELGNMYTSSARTIGNALMTGAGYVVGNSPNDPATSPYWAYPLQKQQTVQQRV
jgi:hypothetical protein